MIAHLLPRSDLGGLSAHAASEAHDTVSSQISAGKDSAARLTSYLGTW